MWLFRKRKTHDPSDPEKTLRQRIVRLEGNITDASAQLAIAQLLFLQHQNHQKALTLLIESPGGSVAAGMALVDTLRELRPPVRTRTLMSAHGMAAVVLASGRKGEREVGPAAGVSLTPIETAAGTPADERAQQQLASVIAELCGQTPELVTEHLLLGQFFSPAEAIAFGLADRIAE
jgi:ATP-dependent Clp protease protease subunit